MKLHHAVPEPSQARPMRLAFRLLQSGLGMAEHLVPQRFLPDLTVDSVLRAAGGDLPSAGAQTGLGQMLSALRAASDLTMFGRLSVHWDFIRLLRNAAKIEQAHRQNPVISETPVEAPIFILGLPRSGTTFLHALLTEDPENLVPRVWQTIYPEPRLPDFDAARDPRVSKVNQQLKFFGGLAPEFPQLHPIDAETAQECSEITAHVFQSLRFDTTFRVPQYLAWLDALGHRDAFEFHRKFLQVLQHGAVGHRWVLKCPDHSFCLDAILQVYPDARFVMVHRDPMRVFASVAHLTEVLRRPFLRNLDPVEIGTQVTKRWIEGAQLLVDFDLRADIAQSRKIHIRYEELASAPMAAVARLYEHFELPLSTAAGRAMRGLINGKPAGGYGGERRYMPDRFGINPQNLAPQFADYVNYFQIAV